MHNPVQGALPPCGFRKGRIFMDLPHWDFSLEDRTCTASSHCAYQGLPALAGKGWWVSTQSLNFGDLVIPLLTFTWS